MFPQIPASLWAALSTILASFGVAFAPSDTVKSTIAAAAGLVLAVYQWQHHRTRRHEQTVAAELAGRKLDAKHQAADLDVKRAELEAHRDSQDYAVKLATEATQQLAGLAQRVGDLEAAHTPAVIVDPTPPAPATWPTRVDVSANSGTVAQ